MAGKECMRGRSEMQELWMGNARVVGEEWKSGWIRLQQ